MQVYTAPEDSSNRPAGKTLSVFLAGSIEQDKAEEWQQALIKELSDLQVVVFNPRRAEWDPTWVQSADNPQFAEQVNWEVDHLEEADVAFFYFQPNTMSPITLMELGYVLGNTASVSPIIVVCPDGFWRQGNVEIMCKRDEMFRVQFVKTYEEGVKALRDLIVDYGWITM